MLCHQIVNTVFLKQMEEVSVLREITMGAQAATYEGEVESMHLTCSMHVPLSLPLSDSWSLSHYYPPTSNATLRFPKLSAIHFVIRLVCPQAAVPASEGSAAEGSFGPGGYGGLSHHQGPHFHAARWRFPA